MRRLTRYSTIDTYSAPCDGVMGYTLCLLREIILGALSSVPLILVVEHFFFGRTNLFDEAVNYCTYLGLILAQTAFDVT